jgi:GNAT superfamily N-acetyltransferase
MEITLCTKADWDQIIKDFVDFWGDERTKSLHNPILLYEFGNSAFVMKEGEKVVGYLFGFISQTEPVGYVKFIGVRQSYQKRGIGRKLYERFAKFAKEKGCKELKAITSPSNKVSVAFHQGIGMKILGEPNAEGVPVVKNYSGPGIDRVVFKKKI